MLLLGKEERGEVLPSWRAEQCTAAVKLERAGNGHPANAGVTSRELTDPRRWRNKSIIPCTTPKSSLEMKIWD